MQGGQKERLRVHRRGVHAEPGDQVVQLFDPAREDGGVVVAGQRERRRRGRRLDQGELLPIR